MTKVERCMLWFTFAAFTWFVLEVNVRLERIEKRLGLTRPSIGEVWRRL